MNETTDYLIRELTPALLADYLRFFDREAFADNPRWASCYCYFHHAPHDTQKWQERTGEQNRAAVCHLIGAGQMHGYLAYLDERPIAWCNAGPCLSMTTLDDEVAADASKVGSIVCFIVAKPERGRGVARKLLEAACQGFRRRGLEFAEAYPLKDAKDEASSHYGTLSMYLAAGFERFGETETNVIVRKNLT